jgi:hypothetical protein
MRTRHLQRGAEAARLQAQVDPELALGLGLQAARAHRGAQLRVRRGNVAADGDAALAALAEPLALHELRHPGVAVEHDLDGAGDGVGGAGGESGPVRWQARRGFLAAELVELGLGQFKR